jgi:putative Mg2+ transporter-C (MgtC) family protein
MPTTLAWPDIFLRLALTLAAGAVFGANRTEHGKEAGLRTTMLVCLAASVSMILANSLISTHGKSADSFVNIDVMRLPLGILTGMGFIGGGAILRRGDMVLGVTTAATLWVVTVIGLCFGGGAIGLGVAATALGGGILWAVKAVELRMKRDRRATVIVCVTPEGPSDERIRTTLGEAGFTISTWSVVIKNETAPPRRLIRCVVRWHALAADSQPPPLINQLSSRPGVLSFRWILADLA